MFPLFILPFDHRSGFAKELLETSYPYSPEKLEDAKRLKKIIWEAFLRVEERVKTNGTLAILLDEESGQEILLEAKENHIVHIVSVEESGSTTLTFIHGEDFDKQLVKLQPTFAKALVRYELGDEERNLDQRKKMKKLADFCKSAEIPLMLEVLTGAKEGQEPPIAETLIELEEAGIFPAIWKLEGLHDKSSWEAVAQATEAPIVVLGRGQSREAVEVWIQEAAASGVVKGFAIGRTVFLEPLKKFVQGIITEEEAEESIADAFEHFIHLWEEHAR